MLGKPLDVLSGGPKSGDFKPLAKSAGDTAPIEAIELFRALPALPPSLHTGGCAK